LIPGDMIYSTEIVDEWQTLKNRLRELSELAKGFNLSHGVRNPFIKMFRMNLGDLFAVIDVHTERHVCQIEERSKVARAK